MMKLRLIAFAVVVCLSDGVTSGDDAKKPQPKFELKDDDRVVFLGNTLIEREQKYGYWETMLTARYPDRKIIFRNLGWDGDTVWAESRGLFDPPAKGYERMLARIAGIKPTVIFVGYGNNEAFAGKKGLPAFIKQYNKLLDDLTKVSGKGVRFVLLSPTRHEQPRPNLPDPKRINSNLKLYSKAIQSIATERKRTFIDLFTTVVRKPESKNTELNGGLGKFPDGTGEAFKELRELIDRENPITEDGVHLRSRGYMAAAESIYHQLGLRAPWDVVVDADRGARKSIGATVRNTKRTKVGITFSVVDDCFLIGTEWFSGESRVLAIRGLGAGRYDLKIDGKRAIAIGFRPSIVANEDGPSSTAIIYSMANQPSKNWTNGVQMTIGRDFEQLNKLREAIIAKNRLYFHSWRPQNVTYLFLFRKHEQGQNAKEVKEFLKLVAEKEKEIDRLKKPVTRTYELIRVKPKK